MSWNHIRPLELGVELNLTVGAPIVMPWNSRWDGPNIRLPYLYANEGYKVVMSTGGHTYFDHPAEASPNEAGFYWACRFNDLLKTFSYRPLDFYKNADYQDNGDIYDYESVCPDTFDEIEKCPKLKNSENIIGIQGQLWSETMRNSVMLFENCKLI